MENKRYFEIIIGKYFERTFQLSGVECLVKHTRPSVRQEHQRIGATYTGALTIESKSDSVFVKYKIYNISRQECMLTRYTVLQISQPMLIINFTSDTGSFICFVEGTRYDTWQNIVDSTPKMTPTENVTSSKSPTTESRLDDLSLDMKTLLEQGELSDVILVSDDGGSKEFRVHKLILSARSKVFSKMFQHPMSENRVIITGVPSEILKELLTFIYTGVVTLKDMKMALDLYMAADRYDVKALRAVCSKNLKDVDLDSVLDTLALADLYGDQSLKQSSLDFISANFSRVKAHKRWGSFMRANQVLALEVLSIAFDKRAC